MTIGSSAGAAQSHSTFQVQPYRPDNGFTISGLVMLLTAMLIAGAVLGFAAHWIANFFYLILLFPIAIGFCLGFVGARMVRTANLRNPLLGGLAGLVGGIAAMLMMHWFDYQSFRSEVQQVNPELLQIAKMPPQEREAEISQYDEPDEVREVVAAAGSFPGFMNFSANQGVQIGRHGRDGINLGYAGTWIYWIAETLVVAGITFVMVRRQTAEPFCAECSLWKPYRRVGGFSGNPDSALSGIAAGDLSHLAAAGPTSDATALELSAAGCSNCNAGTVQMKLEALSVDKDGKLQCKTLSQTTWPVEALPAVEALFVQSGSTPGRPEGQSSSDQAEESGN